MQSSMEHIRLDDTYPGRPSTSLTVLDASQRGTCGGFPAGPGGRSHQCCSQTQWSQSCRAAPLGLSALHSQARVGQHVFGCMRLSLWAVWLGCLQAQLVHSTLPACCSLLLCHRLLVTLGGPRLKRLCCSRV